MPAARTGPRGQVLAFRASDVFVPSDEPLEDRLRSALFRLAKVIEDQLGMTPDDALMLAARLIGGLGVLRRPSCYA